MLSWPQLRAGAPPGNRRAQEEKRVKGIEPSSSAWKAVALPLSYTRCELRVESLGLRVRQFFRHSTLNPPLSTILHWGVQDSNLRRHKPSDLQSDPFDRFGNSPRHEQLSVEPPRRGPTRRNTLVPANSRYCDRRLTKTGALRATSRDGPNTPQATWGDSACH